MGTWTILNIFDYTCNHSETSLRCADLVLGLTLVQCVQLPGRLLILGTPEVSSRYPQLGEVWTGVGIVIAPAPRAMVQLRLRPALRVASLPRQLGARQVVFSDAASTQQCFA